MKHIATHRFWVSHAALPEDVRMLADKNYALLKKNPRHPSLHFKKVGKVWSVRVGNHHRAIATEIAGGFLWLWIGLHAEYDNSLPNVTSIMPSTPRYTRGVLAKYARLVSSASLGAVTGA